MYMYNVRVHLGSCELINLLKILLLLLIAWLNAVLHLWPSAVLALAHNASLSAADLLCPNLEITTAFRRSMSVLSRDPGVFVDISSSPKKYSRARVMANLPTCSSLVKLVESSSIVFLGLK